MSKFPSWKNVLLATCFSSKEIVISDMRVLNALAKEITSFNRNDIYHLKDLLIAWLYKNNYCIKVTEQVQELLCTSWYHLYPGEHSDDESYDEQECPKCGGSGVYRRTELYTYDFVLGSMRWGWHQPKPHALIIPVVSEKDEKVINDLISHSLSDYGDVKQKYWNIWIFLLFHGMIRPSKQDVHSFLFRAYWKLKYPWISFKREVRTRVNEFKDYFGNIEEPSEDLPF